MENKQANTTLKQNKSSTPSIEETLKKFFDGSVTVFESGSDENRPKHYQDRPGIKVIAKSNEGKTIYFQPSENEGATTVTVNKPENEAILDTDNHKMFERMQKRFRNIKKEITILIIDPDVIRARYAMDDRPDRNIGKTIHMYLRDKMDEVKDADHPLKKDAGKHVMESAVDGDRPHAYPALRNVTDENIQGEGMVSFVTGVNPDTLDTEWFSGVPGHKERMERDGITQEHFQRLALYHELGHATDTDLVTRTKGWHTLTHTDRTYGSQKTECIADAHAVLQMARDDGNTKTGELWGDFRIDNFVSTIKKMDDLRTKEISPEFEKKLDAIGEAKLEPQKGETKEEAVLRNLYKDSQLYDTITQYSPGLAYHTAPTIDAAVEFAKKGLKDGSLQKMTDEEVLEASRDIVNKSSCTKAQVASYILDAAQGTKNPIIEAAKERDEQARNNMTLDRKEIDAKHDESYNQYVEGRTKMIRKAVGLPEEKKTEKDSGNEEDKSFIKTYRMFKQKEEKKELDKWKNDLARHLSKKGGDRKALLEIISSEKDKVRKLDVNDVVAKQKIAIMNVLLTEPEIIINLANAKKVVKSEIQKTEAPKSEAKGIEAAGEFVSLAIKSYEIAEKGIEKALKRKDSTLSIDGQMKVLSSERRDYKKLLKAERATQVAAFKVRKDPVAWAAVKENPEISALVTEKSKQRHAQWVDKYHSNLLENKTDVTSELIAGVLSSKIDILVEVGSSDVLLKALRKVDAKTANKYLKQEKKETPVAAIVKNRVASR